jgi:hypothetical protein
MICISQIFGDIQNFTSIAGMFISSFIGATTIFASGLSGAKVWIKVCNSHSGPDWSIKKAEPKLDES